MNKLRRPTLSLVVVSILWAGIMLELKSFMKHFPLFGLSIVLVALACSKDGPSNDDGAEYDGWWYLESVSDVVQLEPVSDNLWVRYEQEFTVSSTCLWVYISHYRVTKFGNAAYSTPMELPLPYWYEGPSSVDKVPFPYVDEEDEGFVYSKYGIYDSMVHPGKFALEPDDDYMDVHLDNGRLFFSAAESGTLHQWGDMNGDGTIDSDDGWLFNHRSGIWVGSSEDGGYDIDHLPYSYEWTNTWVRSDEAHFRSWTEHNQVWFDKF